MKNETIQGKDARAVCDILGLPNDDNDTPIVEYVEQDDLYFVAGHTRYQSVAVILHCGGTIELTKCNLTSGKERTTQIDRKGRMGSFERDYAEEGACGPRRPCKITEPKATRMEVRNTAYRVFPVIRQLYNLKS